MTEETNLSSTFGTSMPSSHASSKQAKFDATNADVDTRMKEDLRLQRAAAKLDDLRMKISSAYSHRLTTLFPNDDHKTALETFEISLGDLIAAKQGLQADRAIKDFVSSLWQQSNAGAIGEPSPTDPNTTQYTSYKTQIGELYSQALSSTSKSLDEGMASMDYLSEAEKICESTDQPSAPSDRSQWRSALLASAGVVLSVGALWGGREVYRSTIGASTNSVL